MKPDNLGCASPPAHFSLSLSLYAGDNLCPLSPTAEPERCVQVYTQGKDHRPICAFLS